MLTTVVDLRRHRTHWETEYHSAKRNGAPASVLDRIARYIRLLEIRLDRARARERVAA